MRSRGATAKILDYEHARLALIGSERDPGLFQAMRRHAPGDATLNRSVIVNWAPQGGHGCRFTCGFCSWRERAKAEGDIAPSETGLREFLRGYQGYKLTVSGGGEPLHDPSVNLPRLMAIVRQAHSAGLLAEVVTKELSLVHKMRDELSEIDLWSFSEESCTTAAARAVASSGAARVSRVCSPGTLRGLETYCKFYRESGAYQIILREDFYAPLGQDDLVVVERCLRRFPDVVRWLPNKVCSDNLFLVGERVERSEMALGKVA